METNYTLELSGTKVNVKAVSRGTSDEDMLGDSAFSFEVADLERVEWDDEGLRSKLLEGKDEDEIADIMSDGIVHAYDTDAAIIALSLLIDDGKEFSVHWESDGSVFWLFHDITHALEDVSGAEIWVSAPAEDRANCEGAKRALAAGMPIAEILEELAKAVEAYKVRFQANPFALEEFLSGCAPTHDHEAFVQEAAEMVEVDNDESEDDIQEQIDGIAASLLDHQPTLWAHVVTCSPYVDSEMDPDGGLESAAYYALVTDIAQALAA